VHYFDHNATTPLDPRVLEAFLEALKTCPGNASSVHRLGQEARARLEEARGRLARLLGCRPDEVIFVSGGTEADNLAIFGAVRSIPRLDKHVITTQVEHPAVLNACRQLQAEGVQVTFLPVDGQGRVDPDAVRKAIRPQTVLISVMHANNETGVIQPVAEIARIAQEAGILFHSDGIQAVGKIAVNLEALGASYYAVSAHKFYGPKGVGVVVARNGAPLSPILFGGRQERARRPGTENVPGAVAMAVAAELAIESLEDEGRRLAVLRDRLEQAILERIPGTGVNGGGARRLPNTTNIYFDGINAEALLIALDLKGFAVSTGSACSSGKVEPSHVLLAMGLPADRARASIRFSLGRSNTEEEVDALVEALIPAVDQLRRLAPSEVRYV